MRYPTLYVYKESGNDMGNYSRSAENGGVVFIQESRDTNLTATRCNWGFVKIRAFHEEPHPVHSQKQRCKRK